MTPHGLMAPAAMERLLTVTRRRLTDDSVAPDDVSAVSRVATEVVAWYEQTAAMGQATPLRDPRAVAERIVASVTGYGPLDALLRPGAGIEDIFFEGDSVKFLREGHLRALTEPVTEEELRRYIDKLLSGTDTSLDRSHPVVDGVQVLDGRARLAAVIPPVSPHLSADLRLYVNRFATITSLEEGDTLSPAAARFLSLIVKAKGSGLIGGETGSGKSTLLAALLTEAHPNHCVRLIEESQELQFRPVHGGRSQCAPAGRESAPTGADTLRDLIKIALRMRPDIIVVGEVRGEESWELARASRVGAGFLGTIHANSAEDALEALVLTALGAGENISERLVRRTFGRSLDFVAFCERDDPNLLAEGEQYLHQVTEVRAVSAAALGDDQFTSEVVFTRDGLGSPMVWTETMPPTPLVRRLERLLPKGMRLRDVLAGSATP